MIIGTFAGQNIVQLPNQPGLKNLSIKRNHSTSVNTSIFTGQTQTYDWLVGRWEGQFDLPQMTRSQAGVWTGFLTQLHGQAGVFLLGDPNASKPMGMPVGLPVVNGASQTGFTLVTRGWRASAPHVLLTGDYIQVGYRLYMVQEPVSADGSGNATIKIWPQLRVSSVEPSPADGASIITAGAQGLFRLAQGTDGWSTNEFRMYGIDSLKIIEAI
jgi:hypothetical protein